MRITIDLRGDLLEHARKRAHDDGASLRQVIETALHFYLVDKPRAGHGRLRWRPETGRLRAGVQLDSRDSLFDEMERR